MGRFTKGLFFGSLFGAGLTWLSATKKGKEVRGQLLDHAAVVYEQVKERVVNSDSWEKMTKSDFVKKVEGIVEEYGGTKLSADIKRMIVKVVSSQFPSLQKQTKKRNK